MNMSISEHEKQSTDEHTTILPEELAEFMTPDRIRMNQERLLSSLPECDAETLEAVRQTLIEAPLIHESPAYIRHRDAIRPFRYLGQAEASFEDETTHDNIGMTFGFDESLGLDKCVFLSWPTQARTGSFGNNVYLIDTDLLFQDNCFVTLHDIREVSTYDVADDPDTRHIREEVDEAIFDGTYHQLQRYLAGEEVIETWSGGGEKAEKDAVVHINGLLESLYFDTMVSGKVWFEYVARYIASGGSVEDLATAEIKILGEIPTTKIVAYSDEAEFNSDYVPHLRQLIAESAHRVVEPI